MEGREKEEEVDGRWMTVDDVKQSVESISSVYLGLHDLARCVCVCMCVYVYMCVRLGCLY